VTDPLVTFPDVERLIVDTLKNRPELAGVVVDNRPPPDFNGTQKAVLVSRVGGAWIDDQHLDQPLVDFEVYGPDKSATHAVALTARALTISLRGVTYGGAVVVDVVEEDGPRWLPDYHHPGSNRYLSTVRLVIRPS
jgi:hypothetical protein